MTTSSATIHCHFFLTWEITKMTIKNYAIHNHYMAHVRELEEDDEHSSLFLLEL
jgi:hypothetical protein